MAVEPQFGLCARIGGGQHQAGQANSETSPQARPAMIAAARLETAQAEPARLVLVDDLLDAATARDPTSATMTPVSSSTAEGDSPTCSPIWCELS